MKFWEVIADNLSKAGWSWSYITAVDRQGQRIWIADAHRGDGKRFIVHADEKLTALAGIGLTGGRVFSKLGVAKPILNQAGNFSR